MTNVLVRKLTIEDVNDVKINIREADRLEVEAASGLSVSECLDNIFKADGEKWTGLADGNIVCIFGFHVIDALSGTAVPWLLSTHRLEKYKITFLRQSRNIMKKLCFNVNYLVNYVDDRYDDAKNWLEWLGFELGEPQPYGAQQLPFRRFNLEVKNV